LIKNDEVKMYINHVQLAWNLLREGIYNAVIDRGIEKVSFSELEINKTWIDILEENFEEHNKAFEKDILEQLKLLKNTNSE
jgi:hypothetical protein